MSITRRLYDKKNLTQWLWFIGLYLGSVITAAGLISLIRFIIPH